MSPIYRNSTVEVVEDMEAACGLWREHFAIDPRPVSTRVLVRKGEDVGLSRFAVQLGMWHLVSMGEIRLTPDWLLEPDPHRREEA